MVVDPTTSQKSAVTIRRSPLISVEVFPPRPDSSLCVGVSLWTMEVAALHTTGDQLNSL